MPPAGWDWERGAAVRCGARGDERGRDKLHERGLVLLAHRGPRVVQAVLVEVVCAG